MDSEVVDTEEDAKETDAEEFNFDDVLEEKYEYAFINDGTSSDNDIVCDLQGKYHVFN